ncbi:DUF3849 domain-containing protein [Ruminococcus bicirculans (ex Wegman et al. 2014)]|uniref:DUF3849 domain-containing protein n=1 Tax=Ruminococcus bicirculans (ex Wegman et al. 2014) TaxID=1160721 RepID=UPI00307DF119
MPEIEKEKSIIPLYKEDMMTAKENGEMADWRMSFKENCNCAKAIDKALNENYADNRLDTDKALDTVLAEYSAERVTHVLAAQVVNHDWDGRYHNDVKAWAKEQTKELSAEFMEDSRDYYLNAHPILIDGLATTVMRKEKELENDIPKDPPDKTSENDVAEPPKTFTKSKDKVKEITDKLESGIKELFEGEKFKEYLDTMSKFHNYSFNNTMLIAMQKPDATLVAGFNSWKNKFERSVNKGEKGIQIFAPAPYKIKKEQTKLDPDTDLPVLGKDGKPIKEEVEVTIPAFKVVSVFDVSQTSGKELPTLGADELSGNVKDYEKFFNAVREASPVPIKFAEIDGTAKGFYHHEDKSITIKENMSEVQTIKTAIHEIAHAKLHDRDLKKSDVDKPKDRSTEEVEAESIAYTVCQHFGIDTSDYSFAYVASWGSGKDTPELKSSLETIRSTASELITAISDKYLGLEKDKTQEQTADKSEKSNIIGNTAYADIEDKQYLRLKSSTAEKVAEKLTEQNIPFSGRINGDKTTLTISKANIDSYKAIIAEVTGKAKETPTQEQPKAEPEQKAPKPKKNNIIGNTAYTDIPDKSYAKLGTEKALAVANILDKQGVKFSGRTDGDKTTLTISKADMPKYKEALASVNKALSAQKTEEKSAEQTEERSKLYTQSFDYAQEHGEVKEFQASHKDNMSCLWDIKATAEIYAIEGRLNDFLKDLTEKYGTERPLYVLSRTIQEVDDMRFSPEAKQIADKFEYPDKDSVHSFTHLYVTDIKPSVIDNMVYKLNEMQQGLEKAPEIQEYTGKLPDSKITIEERNAYGYDSNELLPLTAEKALEFFDNDTVSVYLLYPDGTEGQANDRSDIENHNGIFGVETDEWLRYQAFQERMDKLETEEPSKEALLLNAKECAAGIYQLKDIPENRDLHFAGAEYLDKKGITPDRDNYTLVYTFPVNPEDLQDKISFLNDVYHKFNTDHPKDFEGHSLSVSDVVVIQQNGELSAHFVDTWGYKELESFGAVRENPLKSIEDTVEQNDNSFDGIINNTPSMDELEEKASRGELVSVMDMANAAKADKQKEKQAKKPEQKRSIRGYLKEASAKQQDQPKDKTKEKEKGVEL